MGDMRYTALAILALLLMGAGRVFPADVLSSLAWSVPGDYNGYPVFNQDGLPELKIVIAPDNTIFISRRVYQIIDRTEIHYKTPDSWGYLAGENVDKNVNTRISFSHFRRSGSPMTFVDEAWYRNRINDALEYAVYASRGGTDESYTLLELRHDGTGTMVSEIIPVNEEAMYKNDNPNVVRILSTLNALPRAAIDNVFTADEYKGIGMYPGAYAKVYGTLLLNTTVPLDHSRFGFTLKKADDLSRKESLAKKTFDPAALHSELDAAKTDLRAMIEGKALSRVKKPEDLLHHYMDEEYTDLLRAAYYDMGNLAYRTNPRRAASCFELALFFSLKAESRIIFRDFATVFCSDIALVKGVEPLTLKFKPDIPPRLERYMEYNLSCLYSIMGDADMSLDWLITSRYMGFPDFAAYVSKDEDLLSMKQIHGKAVAYLVTLDPATSEKELTAALREYLAGLISRYELEP